MKQLPRLFAAVSQFAQFDVAVGQVGAIQGAADLIFIDTFYFQMITSYLILSIFMVLLPSILKGTKNVK